jgi:hypothetical protein
MRACGLRPGCGWMAAIGAGYRCGPPGARVLARAGRASWLTRQGNSHLAAEQDVRVEAQPCLRLGSPRSRT